MTRLRDRLHAVAAVTALALTATPTWAQQSDSATAKALYRLEDEWPVALVRRDARTFNRLIDNGYVYTDEEGVRGKKEVIAESTSGSDTVTAAHNESMAAHLFGATAVVTGILVMDGRGVDGAFHRRYRFTDTWQQRGSSWVMIASQDALMGPDSPGH